MIIHEYDLDMVPNKGRIVSVWVNQYDEDFILKFNLFASSGEFTVQSGTTAAIRGTKPDGNGYSADASLNENVVTVTGDQQMTAVAGKSIFELTLYKNDKELSTANFILNVEKAALDSDTIQSESVLRELDAIIEGADTATQAADDATDAAERAEEAARTLTIDDTLTQTGQAADAKKTGDEISDLKGALNELDEKIDAKEGISDEVKEALLACFEKVAWSTVNGQDYYDALSRALGVIPVPTPSPVTWDFQWYATSQMLPDGLHGQSLEEYSASEGTYKLAGMRYNLGAHSNIILEVECKWYRDNDAGTAGNSPVLQLMGENNNEYAGIRIRGNSGDGYTAVQYRYLEDSTAVYKNIDGILSTEYHVFRLEKLDNLCLLFIDNNFIVSYPPASMNLSSTVISGIEGSYNYRVGMYIKSIKYWIGE